LPGTTQRNPDDRDNYDSTKQSSLTLRELERLIALEITGQYHQAIHASLTCHKSGVFPKSHH